MRHGANPHYYITIGPHRYELRGTSTKYTVTADDGTTLPGHITRQPRGRYSAWIAVLPDNRAEYTSPQQAILALLDA